MNGASTESSPLTLQALDVRLGRLDQVAARLEALAIRIDESASASKRGGGRDGGGRPSIRKQEAMAAQELRGAFDPDDVYGTLVDPRGRSKDELIEFTRTFLDTANTGIDMDIDEEFVARFRHWDEINFRNLPKTDTVRLRDALLDKGAPVRAGRFPAFRALAVRIRAARRQAQINTGTMEGKDGNTIEDLTPVKNSKEEGMIADGSTKNIAEVGIDIGIEKKDHDVVNGVEA